MYHACMHTRPPARPASRAAAPPPKVSLLALEDNQSSAESSMSGGSTTSLVFRILSRSAWALGKILGEVSPCSVLMHGDLSFDEERFGKVTAVRAARGA